MKILITISNNDVASRFDLAREVLIARETEGKILEKPRIVLLPGTSDVELCGLAIKENVSLVICGAIEEVHYQYLTWKKIEVIDGVIGSYMNALDEALKGELKPWSILPQADER